METKVTNSIPTSGSAKSMEHNKTYSLSKKADGLPAPRVIQGITTSNLRTAASFSKSAMLDTTTQPTFFYSPELTPDAWLLPKSRVETLRFCQIYYNLDPYIHSIINTHAQYAFSKFYLQYKDPTITELFNKLLTHNQSFDWYDFTLQVALSYYKYGEACVWGDWDAARRTWNRFTLLNPAIVEYKEDLLSGHATIELIPTNEMKQIVKEAIMQGRHDIDPLLLDAVENNRKLPLDTEGVEENVFTGQEYIPPKVFMFQRKTDPSSERGTSPIQCLFKDMYLKDLLRMSQIAVAQKTQLPIELWTVGHLGNDEASSILPGPELLEEVRQMITQATQQPPFSIVYGPYLKYEALGVSGKLLDIYNDMGYIENQIMVGLGVNKAVVLGEGPSVQGKAISLNRLIRSYSVVRDLYSNWFKRNILLPISKANRLFDENGQYIVPDLVWELDLQPELSKETFDMFYKMWKDGLISTMTLFEKCPKRLDYFLEMQRLVEERDSVFNKGDKRLGKAVEKGGKSGGGLGSALDAASEGGVEAGKGNPELRDFALGEGGADLGNLDTELPDNPLRDAVNEGAEAPTPEA